MYLITPYITFDIQTYHTPVPAITAIAEISQNRYIYCLFNFITLFTRRLRIRNVGYISEIRYTVK